MGVGQAVVLQTLNRIVSGMSMLSVVNILKYLFLCQYFNAVVNVESRWPHC